MAQERLRFNINDDLILMREVIATNPYENLNLWKDIHEKTVTATGKPFSLRAVKEHMDHLIKLWRKSDIANLRKSGCEEQYEEKEQLLQSISDMAKEFQSKKYSAEFCKCDSRKRGLQVRDEALYNMNVSYDMNNESVLDAVVVDEAYNEVKFVNEEPGPSTSDQQHHELTQVKKIRCRESAIKNSSLQFLHAKHEADTELRKKELEVEERKFNIEEKKFELEKMRIQLEERKLELEESKWKQEESERQKKLNVEIAEREQRLAIEIEERRQRLNQYEQQQKFMELLLQLLAKK